MEHTETLVGGSKLCRVPIVNTQTVKWKLILSLNRTRKRLNFESGSIYCGVQSAWLDGEPHNLPVASSNLAPATTRGALASLV